MQTPMMIAFVESRKQQWDREQTARAWLPAEARSSRTPSLRPLLVRFVLALFVTGLLLVSQLDVALSRPFPACSQTSLSSVRPETSPTLPNMGKFCGIQPIHPPILADTEDPQPVRFELPGLDELWALVVDLLPQLAEVAAPHAAR